MNNPKDFLKSKNITCVFGESPFTKTEERKNEYSNTFKVRSVSSNEIMIEIDLTDEMLKQGGKKIAAEVQERNFDKIKEAGYEVYLFSHYGKSPYIRIYNIEGLTKDNQKDFFEAFVSKYCEKLPLYFKYDNSFYGDFHFSPLEFAEHWKYGVPHELIKQANEGNKNTIKGIDIKQTKSKDKRKIDLEYAEILTAENPSEQERVSCVMQIFNKHKCNEKELIDYIVLRNKWKDFDPNTTANKIKEIYLKYSSKENPIKREFKKDPKSNELEQEASELMEVPSNSMVDFSNYYAIFKDTHSHLPAYQLIEAELGLEGDSYYSLKKFMSYRVESLRQKSLRFEIGSEVSDNRIHFIVMAGAGRGKGQIKKVLMKLDHYQEDNTEELYEKPMSFELPATRLNLEQLCGKLEVYIKSEKGTSTYTPLGHKIPGENKKVKVETENPGILSYRQIITDEAADLLCEKTPAYEAIMLDLRKAMDIFGDNILDKRQVDNTKQLKFPSPSRIGFLVHECVLPARFFDRGTFRRPFSFHITAPEISEDAAYDCFYKVSQSSKLKEYINIESFDVKYLTFTPEAIDELTKWIRTWNRFVLMSGNKKIRAIGQRSCLSIRHYFLKDIAVLAITKGSSKVESNVVKQACFDTIQFLLNTFECYANNSTVNLSRDIWRTENPKKAEILEWMFYNKALNEQDTPLSISQVQEKISESFGVNDRMARGIFADIKRENLIAEKKGKHDSKCWMAFTPKAEGVVLIADREPIDLAKFLIEEKELINLGKTSVNDGNKETKSNETIVETCFSCSLPSIDEFMGQKFCKDHYVKAREAAARRGMKESDLNE